MTIAFKPTATETTIEHNGSAIATLDSTGLTMASGKTIVGSGVGKILQVVNNTVTQGTGAYFTTTSTSFVATGLSVSITPTSSSSKILVTAQAIVQDNQAGYAVLGTIYRGATNLASGTSPSILQYARLGGSTQSLVVPMNIQYLDSPATTSSTTYQVYIAVETGGTAYFGATVGASGSNILQITAIEVAA